MSFDLSEVIDGETLEEALDVRSAKDVLRTPAVPCRLRTGLPSLDRACGGGIPAGSVVAIVAPPGSGKTSLGIRLAREAAAFSGALVFVEVNALFCDEGREAAHVRLGQQLRLDRGKLESRDFETLETFDFLIDGEDSLSIESLDDGSTVDDLIAYARTRQYGPMTGADGARWLQQQVLLVDSIQTVKMRPRSEAEESERLRIARAVGMLKDFAHDTGAVVIFVSEAARAAYGSRQPGNRSLPLAWGAETRAIEFAAHVLLVLDGDTDSGAVTLRVMKNRLGPKISFPVLFDSARADFREPDAAEAERAERDFDERTLGVVRKQPEASTRQVVKLVRAEWKTVRASLERLRASGRLESKEGKRRAELWRVRE